MSGHEGRPPGSGLYDVLTGRFPDGTKVDSPLSESERTVKSIVGNLQRLLNTHSGSVSHLPDFGLPTVPLGTGASPKSTEILRQTLKKAIERYEPRLSRVHVEHVEGRTAGSRITLMVRGQTRDGTRVKLKTVFDHSDTVRVQAHE